MEQQNENHPKESLQALPKRNLNTKKILCTNGLQSLISFSSNLQCNEKIDTFCHGLLRKSATLEEPCLYR
jgi:hypothetical protein